MPSSSFVGDEETHDLSNDVPFFIYLLYESWLCFMILGKIGKIGNAQNDAQYWKLTNMSNLKCQIQLFNVFFLLYFRILMSYAISVIDPMKLPPHPSYLSLLSSTTYYYILLMQKHTTGVNRWRRGKRGQECEESKKTGKKYEGRRKKISVEKKTTKQVWFELLAEEKIR